MHHSTGRSRRLLSRALVAVAVGALAGTLAVSPNQVPTAAAAVGPVGASSAVTAVVKTADLSKFQAGNIISDSVFFNSGTMSVDQVQAFLESKVRSCRSGSTCLRDWYDTTNSRPADPMCGAYDSGGRERASTIIVKVARACGINPQVILATLEKEQSLVTSSSPSESRFRIAMGQGCPDTAACDTRYYGFFNQVYGAARQFKRYANPPGTSNFFTWYAPGRTWNIQWNPNAGCGSSPVFVQNQATANLYYYTPYQPNAAALRAGYGLGDGCSAYGNRNFFQFFTDWFGSTQGANTSPIGNLEIVQAAPGSYRVAGWAGDPDSRDPIAVHVYVGDASSAFTAGGTRNDVASAYPALGSSRGFDVTVPAQGAGDIPVCVYAINVGPGANALLGCRTLPAMSGSPIASVDSLTVADGAVTVQGWAIDPDVAASIEVHFYLDGAGVPVRADRARPDLAPHYPAYGTAHGFSATLQLTPGDHRLCAYAINTGPGAITTVFCRDLPVPGATDLGRVPTGNIDAVTIDGTRATVAGWALDPDTAGPISIDVWVNGVRTQVVADRDRPDIATAFPGYGRAHGFSATVQLPSQGSAQICVWALNTTTVNIQLGCPSVQAVDRQRVPRGAVDVLRADSGAVQVAGWALDPDTSLPITVHIYLDGVRREVLADKARPDIAAVFPGLGAAHGYDERIAAASGPHEVCVWAINDAAGGNERLVCRQITVP